ncbi:MAG: ABC transporter ATP-binding protein [Thermomicrobiales bacterium]
MATTATKTGPIPEVKLQPGEPVIDIRGLVKRYGSLIAVAGLDLAVAQGEIFGILGPNGAGKTTTLEMIEGLRTPDEGSIRVAGHNAIAESETVRRMIGVQLQTTALFDYLSVAELIELFGGLYSLDVLPARIDELLRMVGLEEKRNGRVNELSGGQKQRLSITLALVNNPVVAFLDEPTTGLDPAARRDLWNTIRTIRDAGTTVVLTTHYMEEAEVLCDRVAIMDRGRLIACDTPERLIRNLGLAAKVRAHVTEGTFAADELLALPSVTGNFSDEENVELQSTNVQQTLVALLDLATRRKVTFSDLSSTQASLEDVFLSLTGRQYEDEEPPPAQQEQHDEGKRRRFRRG